MPEINIATNTVAFIPVIMLMNTAQITFVTIAILGCIIMDIIIVNAGSKIRYTEMLFAPAATIRDNKMVKLIKSKLLLFSHCFFAYK